MHNQRKTFYRWVIGLLLPIAFQNVVTYSSGLADNLMLGTYNEFSMAAVSVANQIQYLIQMVILAIGEGAVIFCSRYWGQKDYPKIKSLFRFVLKISLGFAVLIFLTTYFGAEKIMACFTDESQIIAEGTRYLQIVSYSYLFYCISNTILAIFRSIEVVKIGFFISLFSLSIDVVLNYAFIFGKWGMPELGVAGAALTTVLGKVIELSLLVLYMKLKHPEVWLSARFFWGRDKSLLKPYLDKTLPIMVGNSLWGIALALQTMIIGRLGASAISANSIASTVFQITTVFIYAAASASNVVISKTIGAGKWQELRSYSRWLQTLYLILGIATGLLIFSSRYFILDFYKISPESRQLAYQFLLVLSVTAVGTAYQMACSTGILRGGGDTRFVLSVDLIFMWLLVIPGAFLLERKGFPAILVFLMLKSDQLLKVPVFSWRVNRLKWLPEKDETVIKNLSVESQQE